MKEDSEPDFKIKNILCDVGSPCGADDLKNALESKGLSLGFNIFDPSKKMLKTKKQVYIPQG